MGLEKDLRIECASIWYKGKREVLSNWSLYWPKGRVGRLVLWDSPELRNRH